MTQQFELKIFATIKMLDGNTFDIPIQNPQGFDIVQFMGSWRASEFMVDTASGLALVWPPQWVRVVGRTMPVQPPQQEETKQ